MGVARHVCRKVDVSRVFTVAAWVFRQQGSYGIVISLNYVSGYIYKLNYRLKCLFSLKGFSFKLLSYKITVNF